MTAHDVDAIEKRDKKEVLRIVEELRNEIKPVCDEHLTLGELEEILERTLSLVEIAKREIRKTPAVMECPG